MAEWIFSEQGACAVERCCTTVKWIMLKTNRINETFCLANVSREHFVFFGCREKKKSLVTIMSEASSTYLSARQLFIKISRPDI